MFAGKLGKAASKLSYQPQVNTSDQDDPDMYMMLVPAAKKRPLLQMCCAILAVILSITGLIIDEISDGDVTFPEEVLENKKYLDEVDYDCGYKSFRLNYIYWEDDEQAVGKGNEYWAYEQYSYEYSGSFCEVNDELVDPDFCSDSIYNGKVWLICGIIGTFFFIISIPVVWFRGKASISFVILLGIGILLLSGGSLNWMFNDKCEDVERWEQEDVVLDTKMGASMVLIFISIFCAIISVLVSSIHLLTPVGKRRAQEQIQKQQPRVQTHVVN